MLPLFHVPTCFKMSSVANEKGYLKNWNSFIFDPLLHIFEKNEFGVHHRPQDIYIKRKVCSLGKKCQESIFDFRPSEISTGVVKLCNFFKIPKIKQNSKRWGWGQKSLSIFHENFLGSTLRTYVFQNNLWLPHH